jgi:hypothetical protein
MYKRPQKRILIQGIPLITDVRSPGSYIPEVLRALPSFRRRQIRSIFLFERGFWKGSADTISVNKPTEDALLEMQIRIYAMSQIFSRCHMVTNPMDSGRIFVIAIKQGSCWIQLSNVILENRRVDSGTWRICSLIEVSAGRGFTMPEILWPHKRVVNLVFLEHPGGREWRWDDNVWLELKANWETLGPSTIRLRASTSVLTIYKAAQK